MLYKKMDWRLVLAALVMTWPLFVVLNSLSFSLPESHYRTNGIPIHSSVLIFLLLPKQFLKKTTEIFILLSFIILCLLTAFDSVGRLLLILQVLFFLYSYKTLNGLGWEKIKEFDGCIAVMGSIFVVIHALSLFHGFLIGGGSIEATKVFGFVIYQSHVSYPIVLIFTLISISRSFSNQTMLKFAIILLVLLIEIALARRVGLLILLIYIILYERRFVAAIVPVFFIMTFVTPGFYENILGAISMLTERILNFSFEGHATRLIVWQRSIDYLKEADVLLFGNGQNNYSHNFFLQTLTAHGVIISILLFAPIAVYCYEMVLKVGVFNKHSVLLFSIVAVDWNANSNLYLPYYSVMFSFFLVSSRLLDGKSR